MLTLAIRNVIYIDLFNSTTNWDDMYYWPTMRMHSDDITLTYFPLNVSTLPKPLLTMASVTERRANN